MGTSGAENRDIVYILKDDVEADELRYSLRSLENFPHNKVWFFCGCPKGIRPDEYVPFKQTGNRKFEKATSTYRAIAESGVTDDFWMFNDDFFILEKVEDFPYMYNGTLAEYIEFIRTRNRVHPYARRLDRTRVNLESKGLGTLNYALHIPMLFNKEKVLETLREFPDDPMFRSLYGNLHKVGGVEENDCKICDMETIPEGWKLVSTYEDSFKNGKVGEWIRAKFPTPSRWEEL